MTDDKVTSHALLKRGPDTTFLREIIDFAAEDLVQLETDTLCGASTYAQQPSHQPAQRLPGP